jgi:cytosine/adenosine deaminase-related metal-dependent hydrolase
MPGFFDAHGHNDLSSFLYGMTDISGFNHKTPAAVWQVAAPTANVSVINKLRSKKSIIKN